MKYSFIIASIVALSFQSAQAQFAKGCTEIGLSAGFGSMTESETGPYSSSSSTTYGVLSFTPAYYLADGLSIEPELGFTMISPEHGKSQNSYSAVGNLSYTSLGAGSTIAPFVRIGYGVSDGLTIPALMGPINVDSRSISVSILNAGAGIKALIDPHVAIRTELNYKRQSYSEGSSDYSNGTVSVQLGLSLLLWKSPVSGGGSGENWLHGDPKNGMNGDPKK